MPYINFTDGAVLSANNVNEHFAYAKNTGQLYRRMRDGGWRPTGTPRSDGHRVAGYNRKTYRTTYIIWLIEYGRPPTGIVEHRDNNARNDKLENLREATQSQNMANIEVTKRSKSGVKGVFWNASRRKWQVYITKDYKTRYIGSFISITDAEEARIKASQELFGEFAR